MGITEWNRCGAVLFQRSEQTLEEFENTEFISTVLTQKHWRANDLKTALSLICRLFQLKSINKHNWMKIHRNQK